MANNLVYANEVECGGNVRGTGSTRCPIDFKELDCAVLVPVSDYLTAAQLLTLGTTFVDKINDPDPSLRWYPIRKFLNVEDKSTGIQINAAGYGGDELGAEPKYHWYFTHDGKLTLRCLTMWYVTEYVAPMAV